ncbi:hypothetical protein AHMF7605_13785 [Adhaeribacter arboris]|uniref:Uncharacterized protein n=1 Tax=Adhaeribacter arboris TaxID=2072846 RepID=A0A2T2YG84_9BACT|nr:hypothetical protein AHMF7605_13785 [Adhaeribacter arboris]
MKNFRSRFAVLSRNSFFIIKPGIGIAKETAVAMIENVAFLNFCGYDRNRAYNRLHRIINVTGT